MKGELKALLPNFQPVEIKISLRPIVDLPIEVDIGSHETSPDFDLSQVHFFSSRGVVELKMRYFHLSQ